jgi:hypothetical protein
MALLHKTLLSAFLLSAARLALGQTTWDYSATPDRNWSAAGGTFTNWSTNADPSGTNVVFGGGSTVGTTANRTTESNIVDASYTINTLTYNQNSSNWHVTTIGTGSILTVNGVNGSDTFLVGGSTASSQITNVAIQGEGKLAVTGSGAFTVSHNSASGTASRTVLDMSKLSTFEATVGSFNVGTGNTGFGTLFFADNSTVTATTFTSGGTGNVYTSGSGTTNLIYFGTTTALNAGTLSFGSNRTFGTAQFRTAAFGSAANIAVVNPTLTIRGAAGGTSRATTLYVGNFVNALAGNGTSLLNLTGGTVDARVTDLVIARTSSTQANTNGAEMTVTAGTVDAVNTVLGETSGATGAGTLTGTFTISGGSLLTTNLTLANNISSNRTVSGVLNISGTGQVQVTSNVLMGVRGGTAAVSATINISGGAMIIDGNLSQGTGTDANIASAVNLSGGTLEMRNRGTVDVDTFSFTGGTLKDAGSFDGNLVLLSTAALGFTVNGTFAGLTLNGNLDLSAGTNNLALTLANGFAPASSFTLVALNPSFSTTGTFGTINGIAGNSFTLTNDLGSYQYEVNYAAGDGNDIVATLVPEPQGAALLGLAAGALALLRRRRRSE